MGSFAAPHAFFQNASPQPPQSTPYSFSPCGESSRAVLRLPKKSYDFSAAVISHYADIAVVFFYAKILYRMKVLIYMAIYHCSIKIVSRGKGKSAVASAAYRSGEKITNEYDGMTHDYTKKRSIVHTEILLPGHAPREYSDRAVLWNAVEKIEKAKNSQLAREIELALPVELTREQNISLVREYVKDNFVESGMCADICIHDTNGENPHAHVMLTMRPFEPSGEWGAKSKKEYILDDNGEKIRLKSGEFKTTKINANDWNEQTKAEEWRAAWAQSVNTVLERNNHAERVDHRSYERQGIEQIPTVHMGVAATQMEKRGIETERGNQNREISRINQFLSSIAVKLKQLKDWLKDAFVPTDHNSREEKPSIMAFIKQHKTEIKEANETVTAEPTALEDLRARFNAAYENLKRVDRRLKSANGVVEFDEILVERRKAYNEYSALKSEVKKMEASLPNRKPRSTDWSR